MINAFIVTLGPQWTVLVVDLIIITLAIISNILLQVHHKTDSRDGGNLEMASKMLPSRYVLILLLYLLNNACTIFSGLF